MFCHFKKEMDSLKVKTLCSLLSKHDIPLPSPPYIARSSMVPLAHSCIEYTGMVTNKRKVQFVMDMTVGQLKHYLITWLAK